MAASQVRPGIWAWGLRLYGGTLAFPELRMGSQAGFAVKRGGRTGGCFSCVLLTVLCCYGDSFASLPPSDSSGSWFLLVCCPVFYGSNFSFLLALK